MLAPNAEVSMFPWKEPKERIPLAVRRDPSFLRASAAFGVTGIMHRTCARRARSRPRQLDLVGQPGLFIDHSYVR